MTTIVTRAGKGSPLTNAEVDANFTNLNTDKLELSGGTLTGFLTLHAAPTSSLHAASKGYVDGVIPTQTGNSGKFLTTNGTALSWGTVDLTPYLAKSGGTMTGAIAFAAGQTWPTFNQNTTGSSGSTTGNAATATTLQTARTINGVSFNGSANITVADATKLPLAGGTMTGTLNFANATSPYSNTIQFGDNSGWNLRIMTSVSGTPATRFTFGDNGNFTAVGTVVGTNITAAGDVTGNAATATSAASLSANLPVSRLNSGTSASSSTFWRGDGVWAAPASPAIGTTTQVAYNNAGTMTGSANLTFNGTNLTCGGTITANSDETLKTNWRDLPTDFVEQLAKVKHGTYDRVDTELTQDGVSAQSLQNLLPNSVLRGEDGKLSVAYGNAALVAAIALAERVVQLEALVAKLVD